MEIGVARFEDLVVPHPLGGIDVAVHELEEVLPELLGPGAVIEFHGRLSAVGDQRSLYPVASLECAAARKRAGAVGGSPDARRQPAAVASPSRIPAVLRDRYAHALRRRD